MAYRFVEPRTRVGDGITNFGGAKLAFFDFGTTNPKVTYSDFALTVPNPDPVVADANGLFGDIFLDIQADVILSDATDVVIYGPTSIFAPEDGISALDADAVNVADVAGNFTTDDLESVLTQIASDWARLNRINTFSAIQTFTAALQISDQELRRALLRDYAIKNVALVQSSSTIDLDMTTGNSFEVTLTENATITISNPPPTGEYGQVVFRPTQDAAAGQYTITWPASVIWASGTAPTMSISNGAVDEYSLRTLDGGVTWLGSFSQAFS